jgi:hypothetical protein
MVDDQSQSIKRQEKINKRIDFNFFDHLRKVSGFTNWIQEGIYVIVQLWWNIPHAKIWLQTFWSYNHQHYPNGGADELDALDGGGMYDRS